PEGLGALVPSSAGGHAHSHFRARGLESLSARVPLGVELGEGFPAVSPGIKPRDTHFGSEGDDDTEGEEFIGPDEGLDDDSNHRHSHDESDMDAQPEHSDDEEAGLPTFWIGFSMITGFILMFLIDRVPKHATDAQGADMTREVRLDNLGVAPSPQQADDDESEHFLGSPAESPKQSGSVSATTTTGLVIHAAADGIAMGASSSTSNARLGFIVFFAILIHKAPAAFGLTSVLLRQGLSKRAARGHLLVFSLAAPFGAVATWLLIALLGGSKMDGANGEWWTGMLLLFSAGTFL
ncbi:ZIP family metal transporter, partial [Candidatus Bathyarchaeota archaeon]|nr:ZIP family metal transporter [Candidatus Bathyarchaeota archaeon]